MSEEKRGALEAIAEAVGLLDDVARSRLLGFAQGLAAASPDHTAGDAEKETGP